MTDYDAPPKKPSHVPSWVMLGFVLGALTVWSLLDTSPRATVATDESGAPPAATTTRDDPTAENPLARPDRPSIEIVEALLELYRPFVFWDRGLTQIAVWNGRTAAYTDYFEVISTETGTYFRSLEALTWWPIENYGPEESPIRFCETNEMRLRRFREAGLVPEQRVLPPPQPPRFEGARGRDPAP